MERVFKLKEWGYAIKASNRLALKKKYAACIRHPYYIMLSTKKTFGAKLKNLLLHLVLFFSQLRYIAIYQLLKKRQKPLAAKYNFYIANNPSYLRTLLPVIEALFSQKEDIALFCPANHFTVLADSLKKEMTAYLQPLEAMPIASNKFFTLTRLVLAVLKSFIDSIWLIFQPIKDPMFLSSDFARHGLIYYCFSAYWKNYFNQTQRWLLAANDFHLWDSFLFSICRTTNSESVILAHGRETEISYPIFAKKRFVWGKNDIHNMVEEFGASPQEVEAVGSPYFDRIYKEIKGISSETKSSPKEYIGFFAQPYYKIGTLDIKEYNEALAWFYSLVKIFPNEKFFIKLHPSDDANYYAERPPQVSISKEKILESLEKCKILLTIDSNSMLEASVFGIPSIQCLASGYTFFSDYSGSGISLKANADIELQDIISKLLQDGEYYTNVVKTNQAALENYFSNLGHSLEVILEKIK